MKKQYLSVTLFIILVSASIFFGEISDESFISSHLSGVAAVSMDFKPSNRLKVNITISIQLSESNNL